MLSKTGGLTLRVNDRFDGRALVGMRIVRM